MPEPTAAPAIAFFDVDNTLMRGASLYHVGVEAWRRRYVTMSDMVSFGWKQLRFVAVGENRAHLDNIRERALDLAVGRSREDVIKLSHEVFDSRLFARIWPETLEVARGHLEAGRQVWLVSATAQEVADVIAERLGFTGAIGTVLESVGGAYTGRLIGPVLHGEHKANAAEKLARDHGSELEDCWAYSDSRNDIPLLNLVGHPVAVNPDATLRRYATARSWPSMTLNPATLKGAIAAQKKANRGKS